MIFDQAFSFQSLLDAHRKCRRSKQHKKDVINFEIMLGEKLVKLSADILAGDYETGRYKKFMIFDPKKREIEALFYTDRVVLMALSVGIIEPLCERKLIHDNVACRKNKGTLFGTRRIEKHLKTYYQQQGKDGYALKCDISKFFQSINHTVLIAKLQRMGFDERTISLMTKIIRAKESSPDTGLPIGNQTSQWFALIYLDDLDRFIKEKLRIKFYVRYMDDFILVHHDKEYLKHCKREIEKFAQDRLVLRLNKKTQIVQLKNGIDFIGFRHVLCDGGKVLRLLRGQAKVRMKKQIRKLAKAKATAKTRADKDFIAQSLNSLRAHIMHSNARHLFYLECKKRFANDPQYGMICNHDKHKDRQRNRIDNP